ncbi:modulator of macroautophagy TMEM150B [Neolamprologus brichardi]|uniref:Transmembrane protein 150B n=1 Tax=Neolamprologus brichardi TaxID=32507 RepID=A0A3Q4GE40_NEOBR|nr:modulator of macroautophagy TMEM150B [Neolamprologus brichardi]
MHLWALLPVCLAFFGTAGIWTVFAVAVTNGSVNLTEGIPYISQCGTYNPQSCLFSQVCNICCFLALWVVAIRFQQVRDYGDHGKANIASIVLGFTSSISISVTGNFQQSVLMIIHTVGAVLAFFLGLAYFWVQLYLTYRAQPSQDRWWVGPVRATFCIICTVTVIVMSILHITGFSSGAAACEWILVMSFFCLFGLFAAEFRHIDCHSLTVQKQMFTNDRSHASIEMNGYVINTIS